MTDPRDDEYEWRHREELQRLEDRHLDGLIDEQMRRQGLPDEPPDPDEPDE